MTDWTDPVGQSPEEDGGTKRDALERATTRRKHWGLLGTYKPHPPVGATWEKQQSQGRKEMTPNQRKTANNGRGGGGLHHQPSMDIKPSHHSTRTPHHSMCLTARHESENRKLKWLLWVDPFLTTPPIPHLSHGHSYIFLWQQDPAQLLRRVLEC